MGFHVLDNMFMEAHYVWLIFSGLHEFQNKATGNLEMRNEMWVAGHLHRILIFKFLSVLEEQMDCFIRLKHQSDSD